MPNPLTAAPKDALQGHGQADSEKPSRVRRFNEAQRLARIMDEKTRTIGVDTDALAAQVNAKRQAVHIHRELTCVRLRHHPKNPSQRAQAEQDAQYYELARHYEQKVLENERLRLDKQRQEAKELGSYRRQQIMYHMLAQNQYRKQMQGQATRREYGLRDPCSRTRVRALLEGSKPGQMAGSINAVCQWCRSCAQENPARFAGGAEGSGVSSLQKMDGEDLNRNVRVSAQMKQQSDWADLQCAEKMAAKASERVESMELGRYLKQQDEVVEENYKQAAETRRRTAKITMHQQMQQAEEKKRKEETERQMEEDAKQREIEHILSNEVLGENPAAAVSTLDPKRVRPDHWKGMSKEQRDEIRALQRAQRDSQRDRRAGAAKEEREYAAFERRIAVTMTLRAQDLEESRKAEQRRLSKDLEKQMKEKALRDASLKELYTNPAEASYFAQFGTRSR
eukprot:scaffold45_cov368-Prasinococcus_capsulatus_cf.AAC.7